MLIDPKQLAQLDAAKLSELDRLLLASTDVWLPLPGPQQLAAESTADIVGYGGAAGGGKTDLIAGLAMTRHKRVLIIRNEKAQTAGLVQRITQIIGSTDGYNSQASTWRVPIGSQPLIEFGGLDNPGDETRWQGRPHDLKCFDEVTEMREQQVRFVMGWLRTDDPSLRPQILLTFNPPMGAEGQWVVRFFAPWLDAMHPNPAKPGELRWFTTIKGIDYEMPDSRRFVLDENDEPVYRFSDTDYTPEQIIEPKSRTFIPARVVDNPYYMATGYVRELQALPEPMRSRMLFGDFQAGIEDDPWQVVPTEWVDAAMARWKKPDVLPPMDSIGVDVAMKGVAGKGRDKTVIARRHGMWFDAPIVYPAAECLDGPTVAGFVLAAVRDAAPIHIDLFGVGARPYGHLMQLGQQVIGVNVGEPATAPDLSGRMRFRNIRSESWWRLREALDPAANLGIALPPDRQLRADLCAPKWKPVGAFIEVEDRMSIIKRLGRSPDYGSAYALALMSTPKLRSFTHHNRPTAAPDYDPFEQF